jgi:hypothetical protein
MAHHLFFNAPNIAYWLALGLLIWLETRYTPAHWRENTRWWEGLVSLFGTSAIMVAVAGWDYRVWLVLLLSSIVTRLSNAHILLVGGVWERRQRENHRWTLQYFLAFMSGLAIVIWGNLDIITWGALFFSLGVCGAVKVGAHALADSRAAESLRRESGDPLQRKDYFNGTHSRRR